MDHRIDDICRYKGMPGLATSRGLVDAAAGLSVLGDELMLPAAILRRRALDHNAAWMERFVAASGLSLAPHGKTTMSPELMARQLRDGAWAITAATAHHVRIYAAFGIRRILMANQLVGRANIAAVLDLLGSDPELDFYCLVDSVRGVDLLADAVAAKGLARPLQVLLEMGGAGQRAGARSLDDALAVARACRARSAHVVLCGVEAFEGVYAQADDVAKMLDRLVDVVAQLDAENLFTGAETIVSAGGSAFLDLAAQAMLRAAVRGPARLVLRSGCYLTHDNGMYHATFEAAARRMPELLAAGGLRPALEVWAHIQSRPEAGRAIAALGKRDISSDIGLPVALWTYRPGRDAVPRALDGQLLVVKIYDQHACLDVPRDHDLAIGDLVGFGVSHPCTTFDKWRALFVVDDDYRVVDVVTTSF